MYKFKHISGPEMYIFFQPISSFTTKNANIKFKAHAFFIRPTIWSVNLQIVLSLGFPYCNFWNSFLAFLDI